MLKWELKKMFQKSEMWIFSTPYSEFPHFLQNEEILNEYPEAVAVIKDSPQSAPFDLKSSSILKSFKDFIEDKTGYFGMCIA